jgi:hypothetical protein
LSAVLELALAGHCTTTARPRRARQAILEHAGGDRGRLMLGGHAEFDRELILARTLSAILFSDFQESISWLPFLLIQMGDADFGSIVITLL